MDKKNYYNKDLEQGRFQGIGFVVTRMEHIDEMDYIEADATDFYHLIREGKATIDDFDDWNTRVWAEMFNNVEKIPDDFEIKEEA